MQQHSCPPKKEKMHNLNVETYVLFEDITMTWKTASQITLRNCFKQIREEPGYIKVFFFLVNKTKNQTKKTCSKTEIIANHKA